MILETNNHSVFKLSYHLILVTKYRVPIINDTINNKLKKIFLYMAPSYHITLIESNHDKDHMHLLFSTHPNTTLSKFINAYKSASSRLIKKEFPEIKSNLWREMFWSRSFCLLSTGGVTIEVIKQYIETQGVKHENK